ncbi:hypothetical protein EJ03DRAFT_116489 [Teratosphaeria nubilosa]|uniref:GPI anchored cell wall protein n=1 Tax=Teratosphaeria nubilosa TaxID=161662 RepID=A0A6G1L6V3_9PEZI|nr:hypothetical protein EJ03DRAFT_116489 [Teratosphaeria nubilosa]
MFLRWALAAALPTALAAATTTSAASTTTLTNATTTASAVSFDTKSATILFGSISFGIAASVVGADCSQATYQMVCTNSDQCSNTETFFSTVTITEGPSTYAFTSTTSLPTFTASYVQDCSISNSSFAVCDESVVEGWNATSSTTYAQQTTYHGDQVVLGTFPITAGADVLASAYSSCEGVTGSKGAAVAVATGVVGAREVYKVLIAPVAAAAIAGMMV